MSALLRAYSAWFQRRPIAGMCAVATSLFVSGDVIAQQLIEERGWAAHDVARTARFAVYGGCIYGPPAGAWMRFLNGLHFRSRWRGVLARTAIDQACFAPSSVALFFSAHALLEGKGVDAARARVSENWLATAKRSWSVFGPAQLVNFALVPVPFRALFIGGVALCWNTYLSSVNAAINKHRPAPSLGQVAEAGVHHAHAHPHAQPAQPVATTK